MPFRNNLIYARVILSKKVLRHGCRRGTSDRCCHTNDVWTVQLHKAKESNKLIVIDFTTSWCPPCRMIAPIFADLDKKFMSSAIFFKVDVDDLQSVAQEFGVEAMLTFVFIKDGNVVDKLVGARKEDLQATIVKHTGVASA